jgi:hypothetical protein
MYWKNKLKPCCAALSNIGLAVLVFVLFSKLDFDSHKNHMEIQKNNADIQQNNANIQKNHSMLQDLLSHFPNTTKP